MRSSKAALRAAALAVFAAACTTTAAGPREAAADGDVFVIDPEHVAVAFTVGHIGYADVLGQFLEVTGSFRYDEETRTLSDVEVEIPAESIFTNHERRDEHVRSADFLDADTHPLITFVGRDAVETGPNTGQVMGDLTVRGVTQPVTLDVTLNRIGPYPFGNNYVIGITATTTLLRSDFRMTYVLEEGWVDDDLDVTINLEAIRQ